MNQLPTEPQQVQVTPVTFLAILMFAARHKAYARVEPGVLKEVDRIPLTVDVEKGIAQCILDPSLLVHFATNRYAMRVERLEIPGGIAPHNAALHLTFGLTGRSGIVGPDGKEQPSSPDPLALAQLKEVLG